MFHHKKHIFFDLDHTLWDYETSSDETLNELWSSYELQQWDIPLDSFENKFSRVNAEMWDRFNEGKLSKDAIREERFPRIFDSFGVDDKQVALDMQVDYIGVCPTKPYLIEGARDLLDVLFGKYELYIITNGFEEIQGTKMKSGGLDKYFNIVISSGLVGYQKPEKEIFEHALSLARAEVPESLMIGDNPVSDIEGAYRAGIDQVFLNPNGQKCAVQPTLEVKSLRDLIPYFV